MWRRVQPRASGTCFHVLPPCRRPVSSILPKKKLHILPLDFKKVHNHSATQTHGWESLWETEHSMPINETKT